MGEISGRIAEVKETIKKINLNSQPSLTEIPPVLGECGLLEELDLSYTEIKEIPDFVFALPNLRSLSCRCFDLGGIPAGISKAEKLERLEIRMTKGQSAENALSALIGLKFLDISAPEFFPIPESPGPMSKREEFSSSFSTNTSIPEIVSLPASFAKHPSLKKLHIEKYFSGEKKAVFDLDKTAAILASCPALESFSLNSFDVGKGCESLSLLTNLKELTLQHLNVTGNPLEFIAKLRNLEVLKIYGREFNMDELPDIFGSLRELREFYFAGNVVLNLPPSIYDLSKLGILSIGGAGIATLDEKIGNLQCLKKLYLDDNMLEVLPEAVFSLPQLTVLFISQNNFSKREVAVIKKKLKERAGRKIKIEASGQGRSIETKKFQAMQHMAARQNTAPLYGCKDYREISDPYFDQYLAALNENWFVIVYVDSRIRGWAYYKICQAALEKSAYAISKVDPERLNDALWYYNLCLMAAEHQDQYGRGTIGRNLEDIRDELLTDEQYVKVCFEAVTHNSEWGILEHINYKRLCREDYELICWASVMHFSRTIGGMKNPPPEFCLLALKLHPCSLGDIPEEALTYEICAWALENGKIPFGIDGVPEQFRDEKMRALAAKIEEEKRLRFEKQ
jgi:hypothetical protein